MLIDREVTKSVDQASRSEIFSVARVCLLFVVLGSSLSAQWSSLPVDVVIPMNTSTPGTTLTTGIANAGVVSSNCPISTCYFADMASGAFTVGANQGACANLGPVAVNGGSTLYTAGSLNHNSIGHNDADNNTTTQFNGPSGKTNVTVGWCMTLGPPPVTDLQDYDTMIIFAASGNYATAQVNACTYSPNYGIRLESGHPTTHSSTGTGAGTTGCIELVPQQTYYFSMNYNIQGTGQNETLWVYNANGAPLGSVTVNENINNSNDTFIWLTMGNNEAGHDSGTYTYFQNIMVDWTNHANPLMWANNSSTYTVSGSVGTSGSNATIALTGASTATTTASAAGAYSFGGLVNGSYTITPSLSGYTFAPASTAVTVNGANMTAATMTATSQTQTWTVSGSVGTSGSGATIALTGASTATTTASASGAYSFAGLGNGSYTITPSLTGYMFTPASVVVTVSGTNVTATAMTATLQTTGPPSGGSILAASRSTTWAPGVPGGIPTGRTQCTNTNCVTVSTNGSASTSAQINAAIASAPANTYVLLSAGTYSNATGCILLGTSNVTLRGAGANQTFLAPTSTSGCGGGSIGMVSTANSAGGPQNGPVAVTGSVAQGSTTLTLASAPHLVVGNPIILDQLDPTCDDGGIFISGTGSSYTCTATSPGSGGPYNTIGGGNGIRGGSGCSSGPTGCYHQQQIVTVTQCDGTANVGHACSSGSNITISPGLHMPNWSTGNMFAWWATSPIQAVGLEALSVNSANNSGANSVEIENCQGCWVKGVASQQSSEAHVQLLYSNLATVRDSYFFGTQSAAAVSYGVECFSCSDSLVENDIFQAVTTPTITNGPGTGNVFAYNYSINDYFTSGAQYSIPARGDHAADSNMNLTEGNISNGVTADVIHGTANMETFFRNYYPVMPACWQSGSSYSSATYGPCTGGITTMQIYSFHRFFNLIGNILGTSGTTTTYCNGTTSCSAGTTANNTNVLGVGYGNGAVPQDPNVVSTIMLWGNADPVTGYGSPRFNCSEVPTALSAAVQANYANPCPASNVLPSSFYYSSTPSWWPSGKPWPIIGPDIASGNVLTCTSGTYARGSVVNSSQCAGGSSSVAAGGHVVSNPAMDCYLNTMAGNPYGTSAVLSFNATTCYGQSQSLTLVPPTSLQAIAQ